LITLGGKLLDRVSSSQPSKNCSSWNIKNEQKNLVWEFMNLKQCYEHDFYQFWQKIKDKALSESFLTELEIHGIDTRDQYSDFTNILTQNS
jgi:hypothetical protein